MKLKDAQLLIETLLHRSWRVNGEVVNLASLGWSFGGFDKSVTRLGVCKSRYKEIGLSKTMTELRTNEEVEQTIRHEIGHAVDHVLRGYSAHDWVWKNVARQCGYNGKSQTSVDSSVTIKTKKWVAICENHGVVGGWTRKPKCLTNRYCTKCKTDVLIVPSTDERVKNYTIK